MKRVLILLSLVFSFNVVAEGNVVGAAVGYGSQELDAESPTETAGDLIVFSAYYRYMMSEQTGIEGGCLAHLTESSLLFLESHRSLSKTCRSKGRGSASMAKCQ